MSLSNRATQVLLLSCGSFNPATFQHLKLFEIARDALKKQKQYEVIRGIISPVHDAYGKKDLVPSTHRVAMARLAAESSKWIRVDDWESQQSGWTCTIEVLRHAREQVMKCIPPYKCEDVNDPASIQVKLLCGGDLLESFAVPGLWKDEDIRDIVGTFGIVVICRPGSDPEKFVDNTEILSKHRDHIDIIKPRELSDISATKISQGRGLIVCNNPLKSYWIVDINCTARCFVIHWPVKEAKRELLRTGQRVSHLTFDTVINYIHSHGLYSKS